MTNSSIRGGGGGGGEEEYGINTYGIGFGLFVADGVDAELAFTTSGSIIGNGIILLTGFQTESSLKNK